MSILASGTGIAGLGCQIFESVSRLHRIITAIQDAPEELRIILEEITIVTNVLIQCSERPYPPIFSPNQIVARDQALQHCHTACKHLFAIVSKVESGIRGSKFRFRWCGVLAVLKEKKIADLIARLERAKSSLALAQLMYLHSLEIDKLGANENALSISATQRPEFSSSTTIGAENGDGDFHTSYNETTFQLGIGVLVVQHVLSTGDMKVTSLKEARIQFRFADWFLSWGLRIAIARQFGNFNITIRSHRLVPTHSAIFQACALGDNQAVARLIREGKASPFDMTSNGVTPLHVAAAWLHPSTCKQLLEYGADGSASIQYHDIFWNPIGLAVERAGYYRCFMFPGLETYRPEPEEGLFRMRETMRALTEHGSVDTHQGYEPGEAGYWNRSRSALHGFRGSSEDFLWLVKREIAFMAEKESRDYISSIVMQQTEMFPNNSFPAAFSQVSDMESLIEYKGSSGRSLLHYLLNTNFGAEPGFWMNGLDVFDFARTLLEHGADPTIRDDQGKTPLMQVARANRRFFDSRGYCWTPEAATEVYSEFLVRWIKVLKGCNIDLEWYRSREVEAGADDFMICTQYVDSDSNKGQNMSGNWFVRIVFEQGDVEQELQLSFQFQYVDNDKIMPGSWPEQFVDN